MTRQRQPSRPNRSRQRSRIRTIRFCQLSTPAHASTFTASASDLRLNAGPSHEDEASERELVGQVPGTDASKEDLSIARHLAASR